MCTLNWKVVQEVARKGCGNGVAKLGGYVLADGCEREGVRNGAEGARGSLRRLGHLLL